MCASTSLQVFSGTIARPLPFSYRCEMVLSLAPSPSPTGVKWYHPPPADSVQPLAPVEGATPKAVIQGHMVQYQQMPLDKCQNRCVWCAV